MEANGDEIFLKYDGKKIWPKNKRFANLNSLSQNLDTIIILEKLNQWIEIELWDFNYLLPSSRLGVFRILADKKGGPYTTELIRNEGLLSRYSIKWTIC
jgi:hypothetical protein